MLALDTMEKILASDIGERATVLQMWFEFIDDDAARDDDVVARDDDTYQMMMHLEVMIHFR